MLTLFLKLQYQNKLADFLADLIFTSISLIGLIFIYYESAPEYLGIFTLKVVSLSLVTNMIYYSIFESLNTIDSMQNLDVITSKYNPLLLKVTKFICAFSFYGLQYGLSIFIYEVIFNTGITVASFAVILLIIFWGTYILNLAIDFIINKMSVNFNVLNLVLDFYNFTSQTYFPLLSISKYLIIFGMFNVSFLINNVIDGLYSVSLVIGIFVVTSLILSMLYVRRYLYDKFLSK